MELMNYSEFSRAKNTLKNTSEDTTKKEFMSEDTAIVIDFDRVKTSYMNGLNLSEENAASVDALFQDDKGELYFVEFKNSEFENTDIAKKVKDTLLIFSDITGITLKDIRNKANFFLVVSDEKIESLSVQQRIALAKATRGKVDFALYGLNKLRYYCFKTVNVYSSTQFAKRKEGICIRA